MAARKIVMSKYIRRIDPFLVISVIICLSYVSIVVHHYWLSCPFESDTSGCSSSPQAYSLFPNAIMYLIGKLDVYVELGLAILFLIDATVIIFMSKIKFLRVASPPRILFVLLVYMFLSTAFTVAMVMLYLW